VAEPIPIVLPTPLPVGPVTVYLLRGEPMTLVDTGPLTTEALEGLTAGLRGHGVELSDLELVLLTHHHTDHVGLAAAVKERSGATVLAHPYVAENLRDLGAFLVQQHEWNTGLMQYHGATREIVDAIYARHPGRTFAESVDVDRSFVEGETVRAGGHDFTVAFRPGHTFADTIFVERDGWAIVGDHVLAQGPTVALSDRPPGASSDPRGRQKPLLAYRRSLEATRALGLSTAYPGHGPPVEDIPAAIASRYALQERRANRLRREIEDGPRTAWELVEVIRGGPFVPDPRHPMPEALIIFCDVLAHLDLLVEDGRAEEITLDSGVVAFAPVD
jgi:glyoxylase-like metal-dependent hydrolase (beta-lactamase superfamily II)